MSGEPPYSLSDFVRQSDVDHGAIGEPQRDRVNDALAGVNPDLYGNGGDGGDDETTSEPSGSAPEHLDALLDGMDGEGTSENPYLITNDHELQAMAADLDAHYRLGRNVDASLTGEWNGGTGFDPVGDPSDSGAFRGSLDGDGFRIEGLTIDRGDTDGVGLFARLKGGTITQTILAGLSVTANDQVGGLVARNDGGTVRASRATGVVESTGSPALEYTGGLVGENDGTVSECGVDVDVSAGFGYQVGGLVGFNYGTVTKSYAIGSVTGTIGVGGLVGSNALPTESVDPVVEDAYAAASVTASFAGAGGLVGYASGGEGDEPVGTVTDAYWDTETSGQPEEGFPNEGSGLAMSAMQGPKARNSMSGLDFETTWATRPDDYPTLRSLVSMT